MMRLTCPNCSAQYEVPDDVIPAEGRDVQCSGCEQTWFQPGIGAEVPPVAPQEAHQDALTGSDMAPDLAPDTATDAPAEAHPPARAPATEPAVQAFGAGDAGSADARGSAPGPATEPPAPVGPGPAEPAPAEPGPEEPAPRARGLDPDLSDILRAEAAREAALRAAEAEALETQPDLGLDAMPGAQPSRPRRAERPERKPRGERPESARKHTRSDMRNGLETEAAAAVSRRDLLPDIEEINSTLRAGESAAAAENGGNGRHGPRRSGGFARGFTLSLLVMLALVMVYANAPVIAERLPQAEGPLDSYVGWVDQLRLWLDVQVKSLVTA